jgi:hypothetical protein
MGLDAPQVLKAVRRRDRRSVESSQRDHLERLAAKKIAVQAEENKKISRRQRINRQGQDAGETRPPLVALANAPILRRSLRRSGWGFADEFCRH